MILYSKYTPLSINAILIHTIAICSAYITLLYCTPRKLLVFSISTLSILLLLLYIGNIVAINYWNDTISWSFLINNVSVLSKELQRFPVYVFAFLLIAIALLIKIYSKLLNLQTDFRRHFGILPIIPILLFLFYYSLYSIQENISSTLQGEPLFEFFNEKQKATITVKAPAAAAPNRIALQKEKNQPNIILIHGDALRADRLSAYGNTRKTTPFIDSLISEMGGVKIENSMSNCSETICGIASVTASRFSYNENTKNIFTILAENGYTNNFIGTGDLYHGRLDQYLNPITYNFLRADLNEKYYKHDDRFIIDTLSSYPPSSQHPQLFYLRMMSSHPLGDHRQKYKRYQPTPNSLFSMATWGKNILEAQINAHDNFASQFDGYVENIFSIMRAKGYLDNAVVVIFGDHGDAMGEHGYQGHYNSIYQEEIHVPIIIWASNNIDMKVNTNSFATLMDIPPTLLHHLKIAIPKSFLGQPLQIDNSEKIAYLDSKRKVAGVLYQSEEKIYKLFISKKDLHPLHLFELESDPGERSDVHKQKKEITKKLADLYSKFINPQLGSEAIQ
ncbi:arylsulfatase A-like enzyme [Sinobacterium caligoides]|uniref:Arylsulfatase A-like enzyme n=1 Tax=Sinobacterium caligoides TaxID=933926 RepID=A0A3N2DM05_9GAMM|nr:arylsulfatase A-like enzyme [Sinobacterium caligoides]